MIAKNGRQFFLVLCLLSVIAVWSQDNKGVRQHQELLFEGQVLCDGKPVTIRYGVASRLKEGVFVGTNRQGEPAVDTTLAGKIVIPDSVVVPNDLTVNNHLIFPAGTKLAVACVSRRAFANCRHLTDIVMPQTLVYINDQAFLNCESLKSIVLPARLKRIYPFAFRGCQRLNTIQLHGLQPPDAFNDIFDSATLEQATLIIHGAAAEAYRKDYLWNLFRYRFDDIY